MFEDEFKKDILKKLIVNEIGLIDLLKLYKEDFIDLEYTKDIINNYFDLKNDDVFADTVKIIEYCTKVSKDLKEGN